MLGILLGFLGNLLGGPFAKAALDAYRAKLSAENASEKITADLAARELAVEQHERELASRSVIAEQGRWYTALPRPLFAFASYNAGPGNIAKMRKEAAKRGLDPDRWFNNVELVTAEKIGIETTTYVRNIFKYYAAYKLLQQTQAAAAAARQQVTSPK